MKHSHKQKDRSEHCSYYVEDSLWNIPPPYFRSLLEERKTAYNLRGTLKLNLPKVTTTTYGLQSFRHVASLAPSMEYAA